MVHSLNSSGCYETSLLPKAEAHGLFGFSLQLPATGPATTFKSSQVLVMGLASMQTAIWKDTQLTFL